MPTDDKQVFVTGQADAPAGFLIPGNGQIKPKIVRAIYDCSGAAVTVIPVLTVVSDGGVDVGQFVGEQIAAGGSAAVTWFPHVAQAAAAAGFTPTSCEASATGIGVIGPGTVAITWDGLSTTDTAAFSLNAGDHSKIEVAEPGTYLISGFMLCQTQPTSFTTGANMQVSVKDATNIDVGTYFGDMWRFDDATVADPKEVTDVHGEDYSNMSSGFTAPFTVRGFFTLGQAVNVSGAILTLTRLTPAGF